MCSILRSVNEIWKPIKGWPTYQISSFGRVRGFKGIINTKVNKFGYYQIILYNKGARKTFLVHRLVAQAFINNPDNKPQIDHIDCNKTNNIASNLRWVTAKENICNPITLERRRLANSGSKNPMFGKVGFWKNKRGAELPIAKRIGRFTLDGKLDKEYESIVDAAKDVGVKPPCLTNCAKGRLKTVKNYIWKYL